MNKQGQTREVVFEEATYTDDDGQVIGIVGIINDIVDLSKIEAGCDDYPTKPIDRRKLYDKIAKRLTTRQES